MNTATANKNISFQDIDLRNFRMPIIAVYKNPKDYPNKYVARLFELNRPTNAMELGDTLEEIRSKLPKFMFHLDRNANDHPTVIETWL